MIDFNANNKFGKKTITTKIVFENFLKILLFQLVSIHVFFVFEFSFFFKVWKKQEYMSLVFCALPTPYKIFYRKIFPKIALFVLRNIFKEVIYFYFVKFILISKIMGDGFWQLMVEIISQYQVNFRANIPTTKSQTWKHWIVSNEMIHADCRIYK